MHLGQLTAPEQRVLGALIEKRWTTPDQYPLSLNGLRLACNQLTNRDPVTDYDEATVREAAQRLARYGLTRLASGHGSRAIKYRHLAEEGLSLGREELGVLAVLLLRGPQTPGELKARTGRMVSFASVGDLHAVLDRLADRGYARSLGRRPGQKEDRFEHLLGGADEEEADTKADAPWGEAFSGDASGEPRAASSGYASGEPRAALSGYLSGEPRDASPADASLEAGPGDPAPRASSAANGGLEARVAALESEIAGLREQIAQLLAG